MPYVKRSPGNRCKICGADISYRPSNVHLCIDCKKKEDKAKANAKRAYLKELERRDTIPQIMMDLLWLRYGRGICRRFKYFARVLVHEGLLKIK